MNRIWKVKPKERELSQTLSQSLNISPITAQLLINRGIKDEMQANHFLFGDLSSCHDPYLFKDMEKTVNRITRAINNKESILLYGDYDVDGITSVALLDIVLKHLKANITTYIPNRLEEGYGLNENAVRDAYRKKISLIITVDCGISAFEEIDLARSLNIDVIVTDHHEIKDKRLPNAYSIINPLQEDCKYPFKYLAGVGLAYKLAKALLRETTYPVEEHLDLVALGTVSDLSLQQGENRILTKIGLEKLTQSKKEGIRSLIEIAGLEGKDISCGHIGYILGPRINAMGRTGSPEVALELLLTDDKDEALRLAGILNEENRNRQRIERIVLDEAMEKIEREVNFKNSRVIVLSGAGWHRGVLGIVASRIIDKFYRPAIVISVDDNIGKGSGRSIDNFHLFNAINACSKHLIDFGGHEGACGILIDKKNIGKFNEDINLFAQKEMRDEILSPTLDIDLEAGLSELTDKLVEEIELLAPFGPFNPRPVFITNDAYLRNEPRRLTRNGLKMWVTDNKATCEAIVFGREDLDVPYKGSKVNLVYSPSINTWQGITSLQLDLKDLKLAL